MLCCALWLLIAAFAACLWCFCVNRVVDTLCWPFWLVGCWLATVNKLFLVCICWKWCRLCCFVVVCDCDVSAFLVILLIFATVFCFYSWVSCFPWQGFFWNFLFLWRVWSWLRTNAGGVLNTCKSNGKALLAGYSSGERVSNTWVICRALWDKLGKLGLIPNRTAL